MLKRSQRRRLMMGLSTVLGGSQKGFFLPYRYAASVQPIAYPGLEPLFDRARPEFDKMLRHIGALSADILALSSGPSRARFDQSWFPGLDALAVYALIREQKPRRIVEVGSGHSTRFMAAGIHDGGLETTLVCIDPEPRAALSHLNVEWQSSVLQNAPSSDMDLLEAGDVLFIDSSHILMPGTDVDYLIGHVLPKLRSGVFLHIHDIFLPDPYPSSWSWRGYNEQSAIAALLQGDGYALIFASHYIATRMAKELDRSPFKELEIGKQQLQGSLWLQKR